MSEVYRFSAVEIFGVPLDNADDVADARSIINLMGRYGIEPQEIPLEVTDITPYYWDHAKYRHFVHLNEHGVAVVELMPCKRGSMTFEVIGRVAAESTAMLAVESHQRTYRIPTEEPNYALSGPSPRYDDQLCIHELITPVGIDYWLR